MDVVLKQDVDKLGLRGEVVNVARGYARNFLLPRGLAEVATPALVKELEKRDAQRARHDAQTVDEAARTGRTPGGARAALRRDGRADRVAVRLGHRHERRRPPLGAGEAARRPAQAADGHDQAHRPLHGPVRALQRRGRAAQARRRPEGEELPPEEELAELEAQEIAAAEAEAAAAAPAAIEYEDVPEPTAEPDAEPQAADEAAAAEPDAGSELPREQVNVRIPSTGSPRACGRRSTGCPQAPSACGFRPQS